MTPLLHWDSELWCSILIYTNNPAKITFGPSTFKKPNIQNTPHAKNKPAMKKFFAKNKRRTATGTHEDVHI